MLSDLEARILSDIDGDALVRLTSELVRRPSVTGEEAAVAAFIANHLSDQGLEVELRDAAPGRPNVIARWGGEGPVLLLTGHTDTVPVGEGWSRAPFSGAVEDGRIHGRGSSDMKAGLAGMMMAIALVRRHVARPRGSLLFAGCVDEEVSGLGTQAAIRDGLRATWAVIGEPTDLHPISACKGNCYFEVEVRGRSAHAGSPEKGINAIDGAASALGAVRRHHRDLCRRHHPLLGSATITAGLIQGGMTVSAVPDRCSIWLDRRLLPGETGASALQDLRRALAAEPRDPPGVEIAEHLRMELPPMEIARDHPLVTALVSAIRDSGAPDLPVGGWPAACDGGYLMRDADTPTVLYGPGSIVNQAHRPDESVPVSEIITAARTYATLAVRAVTGGILQGG